MKLLVVVLAMIVLGMGSARGAPPQPVWLTVDATGYRLLQTIQPGLEAAVVRQRLPGVSAATDVPAETLYVVRASTAERAALSRAVHRKLHHCAGFTAHDSLRTALASLDTAPLAFTPTRPNYLINQRAVVMPMLAAVSADRIGADIQALASFHNRFYNSSYGARAADWLADEWRSIAAGRNDISVEKVYRGSDAMPSVVLRIEGTTNPDQVLVIGAHLDSVNWNDRGGLPLGSARAPGADDDGSGIADVTEVLRAMVAHHFHPGRSIHLMAYSGEELGLYGSQLIAADYARRDVDVAGVLQLDMTDYFGSAADIYLIDDYTDAEQNAFLEELAGVYLPALVVAHDVCGYACSDHYSWTQYGYAASFPFEASITRAEDDPWIHSAEDTWAHTGSQAMQARKFARLALAWVVELASDDDLSHDGVHVLRNRIFVFDRDGSRSNGDDSRNHAGHGPLRPSRRHGSRSHGGDPTL